jgi:GntR family transcriptional regulator
MTDTIAPELVLEGGDPFHRQMVERIRRCILSGELQPGEQLPTVRAAAVDLAVNPAVVCHAYAELEREGFLTSQEGTGFFIAALAHVQRAAASRQERLARLWEAFLHRAAEHGFMEDEIKSLVTSTLNSSAGKDTTL